MLQASIFTTFIVDFYFLHSHHMHALTTNKCVNINNFFFLSFDIKLKIVNLWHSHQWLDVCSLGNMKHERYDSGSKICVYIINEINRNRYAVMHFIGRRFPADDLRCIECTPITIIMQ